MQNLGNLDNEYTILANLSTDYDRVYYLGIHNQTKVNYIIVIKKDNTNDQDNNFSANEINVLNLLHNVNSPYILHFIRNGIGQLILNNEEPRNAAYLVFESVPLEFDLYAFLMDSQGGRLPEKRAKLLFRKILNGVQAIHNANICHRDIKPENITFDGNFNPKIYSFELSCINANNLREEVTTNHYRAPEIIANRPYDGIKCDIFSLGHLLFNIVTGKFGFHVADIQDNHYILIRHHQYDKYWKFSLPYGLNVSESFKNLYLRMVALNPDDRPTIEQILNDPWMQEINNLNAEQMIALENELRHDLETRRNAFQHFIQHQHDQGEIDNHNER